MKLKSYIRGIGIGIIVTSAVFLVSGMNHKNKTMSDAEVIARAKELGYVESTTLAEYNASGDEIDAEVAAIDTPEITDGNDAAIEADGKTDVDESVNEDASVGSGAGNLLDEAEEVVDTKSDESAKKDDVAADAKKDDVATDAKKDDMATDAKKEDTATKAEEKPAAGSTSLEDADAEDVVIVVNSGDGSDKVAKKLFDAGLVPNAYEFDQFLMANGYDRKITTGNHIISRMATGDEIGRNLVSPTK